MIEVKRINEQVFLDFLEPHRKRVGEYLGEDLIDRPDETTTHWGAFIDNELCAVCSLEVLLNPKEWIKKGGVYITNCFTAPQHERKGCLTALIRKAKEVAAVMQCSVSCVALTETSMPVFVWEGFRIEGKTRVPMILEPDAFEMVFEE